MSEDNGNAKSHWVDDHNPVYYSRQDRNIFLARLIRKIFPNTKSIVNLGGGGKRHLQQALQNEGAKDLKVIELDMVGDCDYKLNLDQIDALPFESEEADICTATDILEHLENFHLMSEELVRAARRAVIISLPVPTNSIFRIFQNMREDDPQQRGVYDKFYGLPLEKPEDRHRWWYAIEDVERYFMHLASKTGCRVEFFTSRRAYRVEGLKGKLLRLFFGERLYRNIRYPHIWIILHKQ